MKTATARTVSAVRLGDTANDGARRFGKPLDGVRVLAAEQMQALPYATQMLARLGAEVVKVEHPEHGESGRASSPAMVDPDGRKVGATFLRNNFGKRSVGLDLKSPVGFMKAIEEGTDPAPSDVAAERDLFTEHQVKVLLYNDQVSSTTTQSIHDLAQSAGIPIVGVSETMPPMQATFVTWQLDQLSRLQAALGG